MITLNHDDNSHTTSIHFDRSLLRDDPEKNSNCSRDNLDSENNYFVERIIARRKICSRQHTRAELS